MGVVDLLQKHSLIEADINVLGENVKVVIQHLQHFSDSTKSKIFQYSYAYSKLIC